MNTLYPRDRREQWAGLWLANQLEKRSRGTQFTEYLKTCIRQIRGRGTDSLHTIRYSPKRSGGTRLQYIPCPELRALQGAIGILLKEKFRRHPSSFGFLGGSRHELGWRHSNAGATLLCDIKNAFWQVSRREVYHSLRLEDQFSWGLLPPRIKRPFSPSASRIITELCCALSTHPDVLDYYGRNILGVRATASYWRGRFVSFLPQGAPTSPYLFDFCCRRLDDHLARKARNVGGVYSRYADNILFSVPDVQFPARLKSAILCTSEQRGFPLHKVRVVSGGKLIHTLGLNIEKGRVFDTQRHRMRIRKAIHHLRWLLEHSMPYDSAWRKLAGLVGASVSESLPDDLRRNFQECREQVQNRS